jgi:hypothetical protein
MSSKKYATPLRLDAAAVRPLQISYLAFVILTLAVLSGSPLPLLLRLLAVAVFAAAARRVWLRRSELGGGPVHLVWDGGQRWWWSQRGTERQLRLLGNSYLSPRLVVLNFRGVESGRRCSLVLLPASIGEEQFRRLLVRFRVEREAVTDS